MTHSTRSSKKGLTFGLTAGLVGGAAAGMIFGMPGLSGAAASTEPAAIVQQVDDAPDAPAPDERPDPGTRVRDMLQPLVDDGTISASQADAVTTHIVENAPDRSGRRGPGHHKGPGGRLGGASSEAVLDLLGIDAETLRAELRDGNSLADVAEANGVDTQAVIDAIVAEAQAKLDEALDSGKIDAEKAAEVAENIEDRVTARVNGERPERPGRPGPDAEG